MPEPRKRSRSKRRVFKKTQKGIVIFYKKRVKKAQPCFICGDLLKGIRKKGSKSEKRPERAYGGLLCARCSREQIKLIARKL